MSTVDPFVPVAPGDLITAELFNDIQRRIRSEIDSEIEKALADLREVARAGDADRLGGQTPDELARTILDRALGEIPRRTGYRRVFKRLHVASAPRVEYYEIKHELRAYPLVDVYQLDYFPVMCRADDASSLAWVNFYLYHTSEKRVGRPPHAVEIEASRGPVFCMPFAEALAEHEVEYDDDSSLADLVNEFWKKLFSGLNDKFDERQFCHSPWFNRCCRDDRSVRDIRRARDWDDLWLKVKPRKTINYPRNPTTAPGGMAVPPDIEVVHFDLDTVGIRVVPLAGWKPYPSDPRAGTDFSEPAVGDADNPQPNFADDELKLMVLLQAGAPAVGRAGGGDADGQGGPGRGHAHGAY